MNHTDIILFPGYESLKREVEKLRTALSMLVLERDELQYVECKNLEMQYLLTLGSLEYKIYEAQCILLRQKRKMELIQSRKNRQERVVLTEIERILNCEFTFYQKKLEEQMGKMNDAIHRSQLETLPQDQAEELKTKYRRIVKALHPDLHPQLGREALRMFQNAVSAYARGDLETIRVVDEMVSGSVFPDSGEDAARKLNEEKRRLTSLIGQIQQSIRNIKSAYPYTLKKCLQDAGWIEKRKREQESLLAQYRERITEYRAGIQEMLR